MRDIPLPVVLGFGGYGQRCVVHWGGGLGCCKEEDEDILEELFEKMKIICSRSSSKKISQRRGYLATS